jgi:hypothetical protein
VKAGTFKRKILTEVQILIQGSSNSSIESYRSAGMEKFQLFYAISAGLHSIDSLVVSDKVPKIDSKQGKDFIIVNLYAII